MKRGMRAGARVSISAKSTTGSLKPAHKGCVIRPGGFGVTRSWAHPITRRFFIVYEPALPQKASVLTSYRMAVNSAPNAQLAFGTHLLLLIISLDESTKPAIGNVNSKRRVVAGGRRIQEGSLAAFQPFDSVREETARGSSCPEPLHHCLRTTFLTTQMELKVEELKQRSKQTTRAFKRG